MPCEDTLRALAERNGLKLIAKPGRFVEERNYELWLPAARLLVVKCFGGRSPYYGRWIEVFAVNNRVETGEGVFTFAGSALERELLATLSGALGGGELIYVEYGYDRETETLLRLGYPPQVTRLGFLLLECGFTILRDFYFPEGFMEGEAKLQGEKPADEEARRRHLARIVREAELAIPDLRRWSNDPQYGSWASRAVRRVEELIRIYGRYASNVKVQ